MSLFNFNFIFGHGNKVAQEASISESSKKLQQTLSVQLGELQKSSPYSIQAIEVNNKNIKSQDSLIDRSDVIKKICTLLDETGCVILNGDILIGKTCLAESIGLAKTELCPLMLHTFYNKNFNPTALIPFIVESEKCKLIIIDGLPEYNIEITEALCQNIRTAIDAGIKVLITTRSFSPIIAKKYELSQFTVPTITIEELQSSVPRSSISLTNLIISISGGYPMLVNLLLFYLDIYNWKLEEQQIIDFISIPNKKDVKDYVNKKVREIIIDVQDLQLLSRLSLFWRPFTEDDAVALAGVNPKLVTPRDRIQRLLSQRLICEVDGKLKVSSFIKRIWTPDLLDTEYKESSNVIINRVIHKHTIDILDADNAILLLCNAKEFERAGWLYASFMTKLLEVMPQDSSQVSLLTMLWRDLPLPPEMSVMTKTFIRILQIQLAHLIKEDCAYATDDLIDLIEKLPSSNILKAVASCYAIGQLSFCGNFQRALPLLQYAQPVITPDLNDEYLALINEQQSLSDKVPVLMLTSVKDIDELMQWFEKVDQAGISTSCVDVDAVKFVLNRVIVEGNEESSLQLIISRTKANKAHQVFLIVSVARLMLFFSSVKKYPEAWSLYDSNKEIIKNKLGIILINNALACYYNDIKDTDNALRCFELTCQGDALSICPDEVMFASSTMASIYDQKGEYISSVQSLKNVVENEFFKTSLHEYQQMVMRGELAIAFWNNNQRKEAFNQLLIIHNYLYAHRLEVDENYKLLELKLGICVQQYHYHLENGTYAEKFAKPKATLFERPNKQFLEVYSKVRTGTNIMYLYMMAASLSIDKGIALELAHHTIESFTELIKDRNIVCSLLNEMNPLLLEYGDYDSVKYLVSSSLGLKSIMKEATMTITLVAYLPLLPLCVKRLIDRVKDNDNRINDMIKEHIEESLLQFPEDMNLAHMKDIINGKETNLADINNDTIKISSRVYSFEQLDILASINVIILSSMFFQVHKYYGNGLLRQYVYYHSKYVISKFSSNYRSRYKNPAKELDIVLNSSIDDLSASKKMIRLLVAFSNNEVPLTPEHEKFIGI